MKRITVLTGLTALLALWTIAGFALVPSAAEGAVPQFITFQGVLRNPDGTPVADSTYTATCRIWDAATDGNVVWISTPLQVATIKGSFNALLAAPQTAFTSDQRWLGVTVEPDVTELNPRVQLGSVGYSYRVSSVDGATGGNIFGDLTLHSTLTVGDLTGDVGRIEVTDGTSTKITADGSTGNLTALGKASIGPGHTNTGVFAFVAGQNNTVSGDKSNVGGGENNSTSGFGDVVGGGQGNQASNILTTICGGFNNQASGQLAAVGGGNSNIANDSSSTVGGGNFNKARGKYSVIAGGGGGMEADSNSALIEWSTIGGGRRNVAYGGTVGGGYGNRAMGLGVTVGGGEHDSAANDYATIGGGSWNIASARFATVGGGSNNIATYNFILDDRGYTTVGGGFSNLADGDFATVGGGESNTARSRSPGGGATVGGGQGNTAEGSGATIAGGYRNVANGSGCTIGGGGEDTAYNQGTVPGGYSNKASGEFSFAAGRQAKAIHNGSFVWGDDNAGDFASTAINQFSVRASGGTRIYSNVALTAGATLAAGASAWAAVSDSNLKRNIRVVDGKEMLLRVLQLPIKRWSYKAQDPKIEHIGPIAQDFYPLFQVGDDEKTISTIDPPGIALAAIQGLYQIVQEQQTRIQQLEQKLKEMEAGKSQAKVR